jgi:hypothetical protein
MKVFLPFRGEFGFIIMMHAPQVRAEIERSPGEEIVVCCEPGNESLYPGATHYWSVTRRNDKDRRARLEVDYIEEIKQKVIEAYGEKGVVFIPPDHSAPRSYFTPEAKSGYPIVCDVVVCPRCRKYGENKNWIYWQEMIHLLESSGLSVFSAGAPDSSFDVKSNAGRAWDYPRFLDATISAFKRASFVLATDNGLAHLAVMCGKKLAMISYENGLVAPGEDDVGNDYWPIKIDRFRKENHRNTPIEILPNTWGDPNFVFTQLKGLGWV